MFKNYMKKTKCAALNCSDDYRELENNLNNPYCYNFGCVTRNCHSRDFSKLQHRINMDYFNKR